MAEIFVSYGRNNLKRVQRIAQDLSELGYDIWMDTSKLQGGDLWTKEIAEAIGACSVLLLCMSKSSMVSDNVRREVHLAFEKKKRIIILKLEDAEIPAELEFQLAGIQWIKFRGTSWKSQLLKVLPPPKASPQSEQKRRFEAAMPNITRSKEPTPVLGMISSLTSPGLRAKLPSGAGINEITKKDVEGNDVSLQFPIDRDSKQALPLSIYLRVKAPGFKIEDPPEKIQLHPDGESVEFSFFLTPNRAMRRAYVILSLFRDKKLSTLIGSLTITTEVRGWQETLVQAIWGLATLPLNLAVALPGSIRNIQAGFKEPIEPKSDVSRSTANRTLLNQIKSPFVRDMERKLRMHNAHWIHAGFPVPDDNINFTLVYFQNQIEVFNRLSDITQSICREIASGQANLLQDFFLDRVEMNLKQVAMRVKQLEDLMTFSGKEFELSFALSKAGNAIEHDVSRVENIARRASTMLLSNPGEYDQISDNLYLELGNLSISIDEYQRHLTTIYNQANLEKIYSGL